MSTRRYEDFILDALDVPPPGWHGRRGFIVRQLLRLLVELAVLLAMFAVIVLYGSIEWGGQIPVAR